MVCVPFPLSSHAGGLSENHRNVDLLRFPDEFEDVVLRYVRQFDSKFNDILKDIDRLIGPEQPDNRSDDRDTSGLGG